MHWLNLDAGEPKPASTSAGNSQATQIVNLADAAELFHTPDGEAFLCFEADSHREIWRLKDKEAKNWLSKRFYEQNGKVPQSKSLNDGLAVLEGMALFNGHEHEVFVRIARKEHAIYLDLGDQSWSAVKITATGWEVENRPDVRFRRPRGMRELPRPEQGGTIRELRQFLNLESRNDWIIVVAWLVGCFQQDHPFPLLVLQGEQGSAKSTTARVLRLLVDPNKSPLRSPPTDIRDIMIAAQNSWLLAFDNISHLAPWLSDGLCSLATGGGFATRQLYTDTQETILDAKRPILLNGINGVVIRGDALDRALVLDLPVITDAIRRPEKKFWEDFRSVQPRILGAVLNAVVGALGNQSNIETSALPRMADFVVWAAAAEEALGWRPGTAIKAIIRNQNESKTLPLEGSPIMPALCKMLRF